MSYADLILRTWEQNVLFSVLIELTYKCSLNCYYCYNDRSLQGTPLSSEQYFQLFEDLHDMGVLHITFSGGEPLMHDDFFVLGARARKLGFVIRIKSNGHEINTNTAARIRSEIDPLIIDISLHGASASVHDRQTQVAGSFDRLLRNLATLTTLKQRFCLNSTLTSWNENEIEQMFDLAHTYGTPLNVSMTISPCDDGAPYPLSITPSDNAISRTLDLLQKQAEKMTGHKESHYTLNECDAAPEKNTKLCGSASSTLAIDPFGNVLPCIQWREPAGSLHKQSISEIWESSELLQRVRSITQQGKVMMQEKNKSSGAGYCPALAKVLTGNPLEEYYQAVRLMKIRKNIA